MDFFTENNRVFLELFGYVGSALVIISMMMKSIFKLRIFNMCGGLITVIYAAICNTWPVVIMNVVIVSINVYHTAKYLIEKKENKNTAQAEESEEKEETNQISP